MNWLKEKEILGKQLINELYEHGLIKTWYRDNPKGWKLISGVWSPFYIQLRQLVSYPKTFKKASEAIGLMIKNEAPHINRLIGVAMAGIPLAVGASLFLELPLAFTRKFEGIKEVKELEIKISEYGEHSLIEGELSSNDNIVIIDDLVTKFSTKKIAIHQVQNEVNRQKIKNVSLRDVMVLLDREQGAREEAKINNINLYSIIDFKTSGVRWLKEKFSKIEYEVISEYLDFPEKFQNEDIQSELSKSLLK